ncbi:P-loop containing nucleoside triphosphate hydrolase protein [Lophiotrema nucula]|uniref:P-loop containing nucleoside triphosphate hydrolase protein n=1 Tax=Lophiotrema nucula TaxID=690887 RepID=A0A6A5YGG7_9PLEO|nr:P-loop containing nucleoside triphosphate hydrolase protein [Lophiotrema nucula]
MNSGEEALFSALCLAYPLSLAGTYLISSIVLKLRGERIGGFFVEAKSKSTSAVFWLISVFCCLAAGAIPASWNVSEAFLACQIALILFFGASILPDPDFPYQPTETQSHTWIAAIPFEITLATLLSRNVFATSPINSGSAILLAICYCRIVCLSSAILLLWIRRDKSDDPATSFLSESGLNHDYGTVQAASSDGPKLKDAQTTGWLDYLVGFGKFLPFIWPSHSTSLQLRTIVCFGLLVAQRIVNVLVPLQLGVVIASLGYGKMPLKEILLYITFRVLQGQQGVISSIRSLLWIPIGQAAHRRVTESVFEHVLSLSLEFHLGKKLGEVLSALSKGSSINTFLDSLIFQLFPMVADLGVAAAYLLFTFDPLYSLIILAMGGLYLFTTIYMAKWRGRARREMVNQDRQLEAVKTDAIMSYEVVHYNDALDAELGRYSDRISGFQRAEYSVLFSLNLLNAVQNIIFAAGICLVSLLSAYHVSIDAQKVAVFVTLTAYLAQLQAPLSFFGSFYTQIQNNLIDAERMLMLYNEEPSVADKLDAAHLASCEGHIQFRDVNFSYGSRKAALRNISFEVKPGKSLAIVGESGSGKSTLLRLLFRFYNPDSGAIRIDGQNVQDVTIQSFRSHFGVVPQETMLFNDSLIYNILYSKPAATEEEVYDACKAASIHEKILNFPDGYETQVGERGLKLSGGEKQRIAIARSVLKSPKIVLMDEATASLDSETEKLILDSLTKISKGRTSITIAHRLSTVIHCDEIIVLHQGEIVERGSHSQLLSYGGRYCRMWRKQTNDTSSTLPSLL